MTDIRVGPWGRPATQGQGAPGAVPAGGGADRGQGAAGHGAGVTSGGAGGGDVPAVPRLSTPRRGRLQRLARERAAPLPLAPFSPRPTVAAPLPPEGGDPGRGGAGTPGWARGGRAGIGPRSLRGLLALGLLSAWKEALYLGIHLPRVSWWKQEQLLTDTAQWLWLCVESPQTVVNYLVSCTVVSPMHFPFENHSCP
ncbi:ras-related protein Rab-33B isoform X2 [Castor canadensis]|uniref:Ras-related protein Rab-33B isoform X2 n=1 Tax=Castor canadensis TaxID=51338 RepID=A0AC58JXH3_CASCN